MASRLIRSGEPAAEQSRLVARLARAAVNELEEQVDAQKAREDRIKRLDGGKTFLPGPRGFEWRRERSRSD